MYAEVTVNVRASVIVPVYPALMVMLINEAGADASIVAFLVEVASKMTESAATGHVSNDQFAHVLQLLSPPPPSHVLVAARVPVAKYKKRTNPMLNTNAKMPFLGLLKNGILLVF